MRSARILAAVERFPEDDSVLQRGMEIAARHGILLNIVHIVDMSNHAALPAPIDAYRSQSEIVARDRIEAALRRHKFDPADTEIQVETGAPGPRIVEICNRLRPKLVVMRAYQKPRVVGRTLGSTAERVITAGGAPVLLVRETADKPYSRALLAIDGPDSAPAALTYVVAIVPDAHLHMVQVVQVASHLEEAMLRVGLGPSDLSALHDVLARDAERRLRLLAADLVPQVSWRVLRGEPAAELVRAAHGADIDLIALGPTRFDVNRPAVIGRVSRQLLRDVACDMLVGRPPRIRPSETICRNERPEDQPIATHDNNGHSSWTHRPT